jgi:hypothetical protein
VRTSFDAVGLVFTLAMGVAACARSAPVAASADAAADAAVDTAADTPPLPEFGEKCATPTRPGDRVCGFELVCVVYGPTIPGRGQMCTRECKGPGDSMMCPSPSICGRKWPLGECGAGLSACPVCEFPCDPSAPQCPRGSRCIPDPMGTPAHYCIP